MRRVALALVVGLLTVPFLAVPAHAGDQTAAIKGNSFVPDTLTVTVGDTITWSNKDPDTHSVVGGPMNSPDIHGGDKFTFTFFEAGEIHYTCRFHPYMQGMVKVLPGAGGRRSVFAPRPCQESATSPPGPPRGSAGPWGRCPRCESPARGREFRDRG